MTETIKVSIDSNQVKVNVNKIKTKKEKKSKKEQSKIEIKLNPFNGAAFTSSYFVFLKGFHRSINCDGDGIWEDNTNIIL